MFAIRVLRAVAVATVATTLASGVNASDELPVSEYVTLPKFCWYLYGGDRVAGMNLGSEGLMTNCGPAMNHYCYGLLDLQRAKKAKNVADKKILLGRAREHTFYTLNGMKLAGTTATCSITPHVEATMREIKLQMQIYSMK